MPNNKLLSSVKRLIIPSLQVNPDDIIVEKFLGGFTGTSKFIATTKYKEGTKKYFLKVVDPLASPADAALLAVEAGMYRILKNAGLAGIIFPTFEKYIHAGIVKILILEYLNNVRWGYPLNTQTIEYLEQSLNKLHSTNLSELERKKIMNLSDVVRKNLSKRTNQIDENTLFINTWSNSYKSFIFEQKLNGINCSQLAQAIIKSSRQFNPYMLKNLTLQDLNYTNIGFSINQAYFIDPVYATLGDPRLDKTIAGINILQQLGKEHNPQLKKLVLHKFITNRAVLASLIKSYVINLSTRILTRTSKAGKSITKNVFQFP